MKSYSENYLFSNHNLYDVINNQEASLNKEIDDYGRDYILNTSIEDLCDYIENKYSMNPLIIKKGSTYIASEGETDIDVSSDYGRAISDRSRPFYIKGTFVTFAVPFEGNRDLFFCRPSTYTMNNPLARVTNNEILITLVEADPKPEIIKKQFEKKIGEISGNADNINKDITPFNERLRSKIKQRIEWRRQKILKDKGFVQALGYPIHENQNSPKTYVAQQVRKKVVIQKPVASTTPFIPEPVLEIANYEAILKIISNMVLVIERSPKAFIKMGEEDLRQHFLVQLNGHFEGDASGETFNYEGKTDILIRVQGKNIFIAECMYWDGEKSLLGKIEQLLSYTSWRDTKTAILVFNRNIDFTNVVKQIPVTSKKHKNFKKQLEYKSETGYRFLFQQNNDKNRELILTILAFDIPRK